MKAWQEVGSCRAAAAAGSGLVNGTAASPNTSSALLSTCGTVQGQRQRAEGGQASPRAMAEAAMQGCAPPQTPHAAQAPALAWMLNMPFSATLPLPSARYLQGWAGLGSQKRPQLQRQHVQGRRRQQQQQPSTTRRAHCR